MKRSIPAFHPIHWLLLALTSLGSFSVARAQTFDATNLREPADLDSKWFVQAGDNPTYASPVFDDTHWTLYDPHTPINPLFPQHPEVLWYRLHVQVNPAMTGLALREMLISHAFEVYINGERVMACGQVAPFVQSMSAARVLLPIPPKMLAKGSLLIALRVHISPSEWQSQGPGFYSGNLSIGEKTTLDQQNWLAIVGDNALKWIDELFVIGVGLVALVLYTSQREQTEYLWIAALGALYLAEFPVPFISTFFNIPVIWDQLSTLCRTATPYIWLSLYFAFVHQRVSRPWKIALLVIGVINALSGMGQYLILPLALQIFMNLPIIILLSVVIPIVLAIHWRRGNREAGILLIPLLLFSLYIYAEVGLDILFQFPAWRDSALRGLNLIDRFPAGPFAISIDHLSGILSTFSLALIILLRSTRMSRRQAILESEMAAAQQVQQLLVPEKVEAVPGFRVESIYQPAQEVGGDFFQILPAGQRDLFVVVGDVAGKGLPAAMLVSVLVGAIRGVAEFTVDPAELLANLNDRLAGRAGGGFATALAAHIAANGTVTIANAGHLSPYLEGQELELPGALPLGAAAGATYQNIEFRIGPGDRLTFYSDGVIEAQSAEGELFGFDRARAISTQPASAIVDAAKEFGQQDDITVVTIQRTATIATAA
ncbi:MAG: SpoIIE family protein phosphatase [Terracidiphilus sp.]